MAKHNAEVLAIRAASTVATGLVEAQIKVDRAEHDAELDVAFWAEHDAKILAIEARSEAQLKAIKAKHDAEMEAQRAEMEANKARNDAQLKAIEEATRLAESEMEAQSVEHDRQVRASTEAARLADHVTTQLELVVKAVNDRRKYKALVAALKFNLTLADDG